MSHDSRLRDLQRAFEADPWNLELGQRYHAAWLRQIEGRDEELCGRDYPLYWNGVIIEKELEVGSASLAPCHFFGLHESGRRVTVELLRYKDLGESDLGDIERLASLSQRNSERLLTPLRCGDRGAFYYLINPVRRGLQLLSDVNFETLPWSKSAGFIIDLARSAALTAQFRLSPAAFMPSRNLYINPDERLVLDVSGRELFESLKTIYLADELSSQNWNYDTLLYQSPEHARELIPDERSQVFQLGIVFYELLTNQRPFRGQRVINIFRALVFYDPPDPQSIRAKIPKTINAICMKALEKDPEKRFQTLEELARALDQAMVART